MAPFECSDYHRHSPFLSVAPRCRCCRRSRNRCPSISMADRYAGHEPLGRPSTPTAEEFEIFKSPPAAMTCSSVSSLGRKRRPVSSLIYRQRNQRWFRWLISPNGSRRSETKREREKKNGPEKTAPVPLGRPNSVGFTASTDISFLFRSSFDHVGPLRSCLFVSLLSAMGGPNFAKRIGRERSLSGAP